VTEAARPADPPVADPRPVLVLFAPEDEARVRGLVVPGLGGEGPGLAARDLASVTVEALDQALGGCRAALVVISAAFFADKWARLAEQIAAAAAQRDELRLIALVVEDIHLPLHLAALVRVELWDPAVWDWTLANLRGQLARPAPVDQAPECPYPEMRPFEARDARFFFGRGAEVAAVIARIAAGARRITLVGPSGTGKSSLLAAGVLPQLGAALALTVRPGTAPVARLADTLGVPAVDAAGVAAWAARHPGGKLVVVIDQLEELFALAPAREHGALADALGALRGEPRCVVVLALRADFYAELLQSPLWVAGEAHVDLPPLAGAALREAIEQPARVQGVYLEASLVERLLADAAGAANALPLLQETLRQLWERRRYCLVPVAAYDALGDGARSGLAVAIASRADRCLAALSADQVAIAHRALLRLVSFGEGRPDTRRRQTRAQLAAGEDPRALDAVLAQLTAARLIVREGDRGPDDQIDLAHEALITAWPAFTAWVASRRADELRRREIQASAETWCARGRGPGGLLDAGELAAALAWRTTDAARELGESAEVSALIAASGAALARIRRSRRVAVVAVIAVLGAVAVVFAALFLAASAARTRADAERAAADTARATAETERGNAERAKRDALRRLGAHYRDTAGVMLGNGQSQRAIPYLVAARRLGIAGVALDSLFHLATRHAIVATMAHASSVVTTVLVDGDRRLFTASVDGTARLWDVATGAPLGPPLGHDRPIDRAAVSADGRRAIVSTREATAWLWDLTATPPVQRALHHAAAINAVAISGDGTRVVTGSSDRTTVVWDAATGAVIARLRCGAEVLAVDVNPDGTRVVALTTDGEAEGIWDVATGARLAPLVRDVLDDTPRAHHQYVGEAHFSADGRRIATASVDGTAVVWDAATGAALAQTPPQRAAVAFAALSPDDARLVTVGDDRQLRIWDAAAPRAPLLTVEIPTTVTSAVYSPDGTRLLVQGYDKTVRVLDAATGAVIVAFDLESGAGNAALGRDPTRLVIGGGDGLVRVLRLAPPRVQALSREPRFWSAAFAPDGRTIVADSGVLGLLRWRDGAWSKRLGMGGVADLAFSPDGARLAALTVVGDVQLVDVADWRFEPTRRGTSDALRDGVRTPPRGALSPDGTRYASIDGPRTARVWDARTREPISGPLGHADAVRTVRFSPDGRRVVTASSDGTAQVWDAATGAPIGDPLVHPPRSVVKLALFSPDGAWIATVCSDSRLRLWDAARRAPAIELRGHASWLVGAAFSPDGTRIATWSDDRSLRLWDVAKRALAIPPIEHDGRVESAAFSPDGARLATSTGKLVQLWDAATGAAIGPAMVHGDVVWTVAFRPDGDALVVAGFDGVSLWDVAVDHRPAAEWDAVERTSAYPQLRDTLER
jgi:WD40 repeat protein